MTLVPQRREIRFSDSYSDFELKLLLWASEFTAVSFLTSNEFRYPGPNPTEYHNIIACDAVETFVSDEHFFDGLADFHRDKKDWLFGHLSYDLRVQLEVLPDENIDRVGFESGLFFVPRHLFIRRHNEWIYQPHSSVRNPEDILESIRNIQVPEVGKTSITLEPRMDREAYYRAFEQIRKRLQRGDIYEVNLCQEFYNDSAEVDPVDLFRRINAYAEAPYSAFYRSGGHYAICASPERYLNVTDNVVISQPIKGTGRRMEDSDADQIEINRLVNDAKERSENVMIVDLVRNDLSRNAVTGSVSVPELFGVYSFKSVHQLISTVRAELPEGKSVFDVLKATFPMGSMTGAPKISAMKIIDDVECFRRGLYSGSIGFITPNGNADFNVVIRSLLYNADKKYMSLPVGGAITIQAEAEAEYLECLLKAQAIRKLLQGDSYL